MTVTLYISLALPLIIEEEVEVCRSVQSGGCEPEGDGMSEEGSPFGNLVSFGVQRE